MRPRLRRWLQPRFERLERWRAEVLEIRHGDPLADRFAEFGEGSVVRYPVRWLGNVGAIAIGRDVTIQSGVIFEALAPPGSVMIRIDDGGYVGHRSRLVAVNGIVMEAEACIGHNVTVTDTVHDYKSDPSVPPWRAELKVGRPLRIGEGAWIGNNTVLAGGFTIAARAVIGANSYVNQDVAADTVVAGNPARAVRRRRTDGQWEWLVDPSTLDIGSLPDPREQGSA